jgi:hypothetical protein
MRQENPGKYSWECKPLVLLLQPDYSFWLQTRRECFNMKSTVYACCMPLQNQRKLWITYIFFKRINKLKIYKQIGDNTCVFNLIYPSKNRNRYTYLFRHYFFLQFLFSKLYLQNLVLTVNSIFFYILVVDFYNSSWR